MPPPHLCTMRVVNPAEEQADGLDIRVKQRGAPPRGGAPGSRGEGVSQQQSLMTPDLCQRRVGLTHVRCWGGWSFREVHRCLSSPPLLAVSPPTVKTRRPLLLLCCSALKPFEESESWNWKSPLNLEEDKGKTHGGDLEMGQQYFLQCQFLSSLEPNRAAACSVASAMTDFLQFNGLYPSRLLCPWDFPSKNTGVGCHAFLQGIVPTQD